MGTVALILLMADYPYVNFVSKNCKTENIIPIKIAVSHVLK